MNKSFSFIFLEPGDKVLVVHRRLFEKDRPRFFVGTVDGFNEANGLLKITGYTISDCGGAYTTKKQSRTKILSLTSGMLLVYQLPMETSPSKAVIARDGEGRTRLVDGGALDLDLSERDERANDSVELLAASPMRTASNG